MKKYQYMSVSAISVDDNDDLSDVNVLAAKGWRVIDVRRWSNGYNSGTDYIMEHVIEMEGEDV